MKSSLCLLFVCGLCIAIVSVAVAADADTSKSSTGSSSDGTAVKPAAPAAAAAATTPTSGELKIYKRLIPADVLRDFPGMCFASTRCATVEPGKTWELTPFCGRSTCVQNEDNPTKLLELVEDCGPLPLANDKCKLDTDKTNKTAPFPYCCPIFTCEEGIELEYPELPKDAVKTTTA